MDPEKHVAQIEAALSKLREASRELYALDDAPTDMLIGYAVDGVYGACGYLETAIRETRERG